MNYSKLKFKNLILLAIFTCFSASMAMAQLGLTDGPSTDTDPHPWSTSFTNLYPANSGLNVVIGGHANTFSTHKLYVSGGNNNKNGIYAYTYGHDKRSISATNSYSTGWAAYLYGRVYMRGNVGINTTEPKEKLHVKGNALIEGNIEATGDIDAAINKRIRVGDSSGSNLSLHAATCCPGAYVDYAGGPLTFRRAGIAWDAPLNLQSNGTVVIGGSAIYDGHVINTNGHKLSVNGGIWCEEVEVTANVPASDYVFYDDYKLMPLKEVEKFVNENHHLPEVPSAAEFKKNGYKVGDMDDLLLRKVEELTLYTIEANKQIETLTSENTQLLEKLLQMEARLSTLEEK